MIRRPPTGIELGEADLKELELFLEEQKQKMQSRKNATEKEKEKEKEDSGVAKRSNEIKERIGYRLTPVGTDSQSVFTSNNDTQNNA